MTTEIERTYALENTLNFLIGLLNPKLTPRVPLEIRRQARACLKHYPHGIDLMCLHAICNCGVFAEVKKNKKIVTKKKRK